MRVLLAATVAGLVSAGAAGAASFPPPPLLRSMPLIQLDKAKARAGQLSCTAHTTAKIGRSRHRLLPVACEQPPRSKVLDGSFAILP